jgi:hypothetical protein
VLGVVVAEAQLLELALHEPEVQVLTLVLQESGVQLALEARDLLGRVAGGLLDARRRELLHDLLVLRVGVQPRLLGADLVLEVADLDPVEAGLVLLPGAAKEVVVGHRPERADEQEHGEDQPERAVRALLVVLWGVVSTRHGSAQTFRSRSRPAAKTAMPASVRYSSFHMSSRAMPQ